MRTNRRAGLRLKRRTPKRTWHSSSDFRWLRSRLMDTNSSVGYLGHTREVELWPVLLTFASADPGAALSEELDASMAQVASSSGLPDGLPVGDWSLERYLLRTAEGSEASELHGTKSYAFRADGTYGTSAIESGTWRLDNSRTHLVLENLRETVEYRVSYADDRMQWVATVEGAAWWQALHRKKPLEPMGVSPREVRWKVAPRPGKIPRHIRKAHPGRTTCEAQLHVEANGHVSRVSFGSCPEAFHEFSSETLLNWRAHAFTPAVPFTTTIGVTYVVDPK